MSKIKLQQQALNQAEMLQIKGGRSTSLLGSQTPLIIVDDVILASNPNHNAMGLPGTVSSIRLRGKG